MLKPLLSKLQDKRIILATSSKQRADILRSTGLKFDVHPSDFEENLDPAKYDFSNFVQQTALGKVNSVYEELKETANKPDLIIGADTMVAYENKIYGKPKTNEQAIQLIKSLTQNKLPHEVYTGVAIRYLNKVSMFTEITKVYMTPLTDEEVYAYVETGEPMGKAGGYAIQGIASSFVRRIEGDYFNVIGLPICALSEKLKIMLAEA